MTPENQFKRNIAYKLRIGDLLVGKPIINGERFSFLELGDKKIIRINLIGNIVERYDNPGEKQYSFLTVDDGSGQIKVKAFGDDVKRLNEVVQGQTVLIIGVLRYFNNEIYVSPEIVKVFQPEYLLIRKLEIEKEKKKNAPMKKEEVVAISDKILGKIKDSEPQEGIEVDKIIMELRDTSPDIINQEIQRLLEQGIIFEPRPGKVRYLG